MQKLGTQKIDAITLKHLAADLRTMLLGAKVSKIMHPHRDEFLMTVWGHEYDNAAVRPRGELNQLYINLNPEFSCVFLMDAKTEKDRLLRTTLHQPTAFCMLLRKLLGNAKIIDVATIPDERALNLTFENFNELGNKVHLVLSIELMGKHSNMILYDNIQQVVLAVSHSVSKTMSQYRELTIGLPYAPPPRDAKKKSLWQLTPIQFEQMVNNLDRSSVLRLSESIAHAFEGLGTALVSQVVGAVGDLNQPNFSGRLYERLWQLNHGGVGQIQPYGSKCTHAFSLLPMPDGQAYDTVHAMMHDYWIEVITEKRVEHLRADLKRQLDVLEKKRAKRETTLTPMTLDEIEDLQQQGHLILAALSTGELPPQPLAGTIVLTDMASGVSRSVAVDPSIGWTENAALYYRRAKKSKTRLGMYKETVGELSAERDFLAELMLMVEQSDTMSDLLAIEEDMKTQGLIKTKDEKSTAGLKVKMGKSPIQYSGVMTIELPSGIQIFVGRTSFANGYLVSKLGKPEDLWLHVQQMPGSHVLVRQPAKTNQPVTDDILWQAANLAVYYSSARESKNVPVIYTPLKFVRHIPGSYPGHVTYKQEKTVFVTLDEMVIADVNQFVISRK